MKFLNSDVVHGVLNWREAVDAIRKGHNLPKPIMHDSLIGPEDGMLINRSARIEGLGYGVKVESIFNQNAKNGLPNTHGAVLVYAAKDGKLRGVIDSHGITDLKTAADSVFAATLLANTESKHLVIVGAGRVAANLAQAYSALFPSLEKISIWARKLEQAQILAERLKFLSVPVVAVTDLESALGSADIVSSATMAKEPIIPGKWIRSGTHIDLIGAYTSQMREADDELIAKALLYVDHYDTTDHIGEISIPIQSGAIPKDHIQGDLYQLVTQDEQQTPVRNEITVFKNGGGGHLDLMIADALLTKLGL